MEYGPNLRAYAVYLLVVHFVPVHRVVEILTSLTGATPSAGFVHSLLRRAARALSACDFAIRTLITLAFAVCADETPLKVGPATPAPGKKEAKGYLHVACTDLYTHFLLGDRSMRTFRQSVLADLEPGAVAVHDRYQAYDSAQLGELNHQLCLAHVLRDLAGAAELYPGQLWPGQLADELRELIHRANQARMRGETSLPQRIKDLGVRGLRAAARIGLGHTEHLNDDRPGARKARLLLEAFHKREEDFLRFTTDLRVPPTSNQAERDLRPSKIQENISGRLTDLERAKDRYLIRGVLSTAAKHAVNPSPCSGTRSPEPLGCHPQPAPDTPASRRPTQSPAVTTRPNPSPSAHQLNVYGGASGKRGSLVRASSFPLSPTAAIAATGRCNRQARKRVRPATVRWAGTSFLNFRKQEKASREISATPGM
ncbi:transposase [Streptomyces chiangmaiensis]